jgi:hypothetical protein
MILGTNVIVVKARQFYPLTFIASEPNMPATRSSEVGPV